MIVAVVLPAVRVLAVLVGRVAAGAEAVVLLADAITVITVIAVITAITATAVVDKKPYGGGYTPVFFVYQGV